jgi:3-isopropylmalate/(R)-2-methylmalate dehydratase small subunit
MKLRSRCWKFGDHVDTDVIAPNRYLTTDDPQELVKHLMADSDHEDFYARVRPGDVIVAGKLFGLGSSREHAPLMIKTAGVAAVIATSFARIFLRNAINIGLPVLENATLWPVLAEGDEVEIDVARGEILHAPTRTLHRAAAYPDFLLAIIAAGGLVNFTMQQMAAAGPLSEPSAPRSACRPSSSAGDP